MTSVQTDPADPKTAPTRSLRSWVVLAVRVAVDFGAPVAAYYVLRAYGVSVYLALLISTLLSAVSSLLQFVRRRQLDGISTFATTMMVGAVGVSLLAGSPQFMMAKGALLTGVSGIWFIASLWAERPLSYVLTRPLLEGRFHWPWRWDELWDRSPAFRRIWQVSSVLWGIGTLLDAALRVATAYTLPPDSVPALNTTLYIATCAVLIVVTNVYYIAAGIHNRDSAIYQPAGNHV